MKKTWGLWKEGLCNKMENANKQDEGSKLGKIAIVRIRGLTGVRFDIDDTLRNLRLTKRNYCVIVPKNDSYTGMVLKVKDYVTWGDLNDQTFKLLMEKRKEDYKDSPSDRKNKISYSNKFTEVDGRRIKKVFRLNSPRKGYGRNGIKIPFNKGGALGYRGDKINDLIERMI